MKTVSMGLLMLVSLAQMGKGDEAARGATLTGITSMRVIVENIASHGDLQSQIQSDVEEKLRTAGIVVAADDPNGFLYVSVIINGPVSNSTSYVYSITVGYQQKVRLERNGALAWGTTWDVGSTGLSTLPVVRGAVANNVDKFTNAYVSVNPKQ
jgi:hypothetical protein